LDLLILKYLVLVLTFGSGFVVVGYEDHAEMKGWPVGSWLSGDTSLMKLLSVVCMLSAIVISFMVFSWWSPLVVILAGICVGFLASQLLKSWVQLPAIVGVAAGFVLCPLWVL
jgi:hypothetical protein